MKAKPVARAVLLVASLFAAVASVVLLDQAGRVASSWLDRALGRNPAAHVTHLPDDLRRVAVCVAAF